MIVVLSGTNRPGSHTRRVSAIAVRMLGDHGVPARLLDLEDLPRSVLDPASYDATPEDFEPFQRAVSDAAGMIVVTPEYNGSFPGVLKLFIDVLRFPESLLEMPAAFGSVCSM